MNKFLSENELIGFENKYYKDKYYRISCVELNEQKFDDQVFENVNISLKSFALRFDRKDSISAYMILCLHFIEEKVEVNKETFSVKNEVENFLEFIELIKDNNIIEAINMEDSLHTEIASSMYHIEDGKNTDERNIDLALKKWNDRK